MTMKTIPRWLAKYWVWYKRLGLPVLHSNQRVWYKYPWPKRLTLPTTHASTAGYGGCGKIHPDDISQRYILAMYPASYT